MASTTVTKTPIFLASATGKPPNPNPMKPIATLTTAITATFALTKAIIITLVYATIGFILTIAILIGSAIVGSILWNIAAPYLAPSLARLLSPYTAICVATTFPLTLLVDPQTLSVAFFWITFPFTQKDPNAPIFPPHYKPTYGADPGIYWRTIFFFQERVPTLVWKFLVVFSLVYLFDLNPTDGVVYFLRVAVRVYIPCVVLSYVLRLRGIARAVFREILSKPGEAGVGVFRQGVAVGHVLGRNVTIVILILFAYLAYSGIVTSVLSKFAGAIWSKGLLAASGTLMRAADVLFDMTDDRIVYKGVVIRYL